MHRAAADNERSQMFWHAAGFRPLWPVILFLPWVLVGIAWLVRSLFPADRQVRPLVQIARRAPLRPRRHPDERGSALPSLAPRSSAGARPGAP